MVIGCDKCRKIVGCLTNKTKECGECMMFAYCTKRKTEQPHIWVICVSCQEVKDEKSDSV